MATLTTRFNEMLSRLEAASLYEAAVQKARQPDTIANSPAPKNIPQPEGTSDFPDGVIGEQKPGNSETMKVIPTQESRLIQTLHSLTSGQLIQGIVLSEVLGKPMSQRRSNCRP